jgi:hypothetical protein
MDCMPMKIPAMLAPAVSPSTFDEDSPHRLGRGREKVCTIIPQPFLPSYSFRRYEAHIRLVDQACRV